MPLEQQMSDLIHVGRSNLRQGAVYMLVGLIWGMIVPSTPFPRLALGAHIQLTANGIMFLVAGLVMLHLPIAKSGLSAKLFIAGPWLTWLVMLSEMANAWWGTKNMLPIAAGQAGATGAEGWQEGIVTGTHIIGAIVLIAYWGAILLGLCRKLDSQPQTTMLQP
jgi:hydroxylaminobenzene mutase